MWSMVADSRGRWEAIRWSSTSSISTISTWFDRAGNFHSDALHVVERYTLSDADHIDYEVTIEDPKVFTRPWNHAHDPVSSQGENIQMLKYECYGFDYEKYSKRLRSPHPGGGCGTDGVRVDRGNARRHGGPGTAAPRFQGQARMPDGRPSLPGVLDRRGRRHLRPDQSTRRRDSRRRAEEVARSERRGPAAESKPRCRSPRRPDPVSALGGGEARGFASPPPDNPTKPEHVDTQNRCLPDGPMRDLRRGI